MTALRDAAALLAFVAVGVATHHASAGAFGRDAACFLGGWFAVTALTRPYTRTGWWRLAATWVVGVSAAVLVRAAFVGHVAYDFWGVALGFTAVFVYAVRFSATAWSRSRISATSPPRSSNRGS